MEPASFVVPLKHVCVFAAAVQCLGKIGKELFFEMSHNFVRWAACSAEELVLSG